MTVERTLPATIAAPVQREFVEKKSRFIANAHPVSSVTDADEVIAAIRKRHWDAGHNCVAMITGVLGDQARSSDDGEPGGTAGVPMLEVLRRRELTDLVVVVTRYFGGVKLGAGGLVRAYSTAVSEALDIARIVRREVLTQAKITVEHAEAGRVENMLRQWAPAHGATMGVPTYGALAEMELWVPGPEKAALVDDLAAATAGDVAPKFGIERVVDIV